MDCHEKVNQYGYLTFLSISLASCSNAWRKSTLVMYFPNKLPYLLILLFVLWAVFIVNHIDINSDIQTSDLIDVIGFGRGFHEGDALTLSKLLPSLTLHSPPLLPVALVANQ